jgi:hypothetical protein
MMAEAVVVEAVAQDVLSEGVLWLSVSGTVSAYQLGVEGTASFDEGF